MEYALTELERTPRGVTLSQLSIIFGERLRLDLASGPPARELV